MIVIDYLHHQLMKHREIPILLTRFVVLIRCFGSQGSKISGQLRQLFMHFRLPHSHTSLLTENGEQLFFVGITPLEEPCLAMTAGSC